MLLFVFVKQKPAYDMRISDWSSDVCSSDLPIADHEELSRRVHGARVRRAVLLEDHDKGEVTALIGHTTGADTADNQAVHQIEEDRLASGSVDQAAVNPRRIVE